MKINKEKILIALLTSVEIKLTSLNNELKLYQNELSNHQKSSMGDKYETSRAMIHLEMEKISKRLQVLQTIRLTVNNEIQHSKIDKEEPTIGLGSLVELNTGMVLILAPYGLLKTTNMDIMVISPKAPLATEMMGLKKGGEFRFNKRAYVVKNIY